VIGKSIAIYTITEKIGQGGMGEVCRATDTKLKRDLALFIFLAILSLLTGLTTAQSRLIFPRLVFEEGTLTGIAVLNPNATSCSRVNDGFSTELNLVNPSAETATVELTLQGGETPFAADLLEFPALGVRRLDVADVFAEILPAGADAFPDPAIVSVISTQKVAGFAFVRQPEGNLFGLNVNALVARGAAVDIAAAA